MNPQELQYALDHQKRWLTSVEYGGPYDELMQIYDRWKETGAPHLHNKICILARIYDNYLSDRQAELDRGHKLLLELRFELETGVPLKALKRCEVPQLSDRALDLLILYLYKVPYLNFGVSKNQYYGAVVQMIINHHSCVYCNSIHHTKSQCPILQRKRCFRCKCLGHVASHCK
jgi:hypothetical protein